MINIDCIHNEACEISITKYRLHFYLFVSLLKANNHQLVFKICFIKVKYLKYCNNRPDIYSSLQVGKISSCWWQLQAIIDCLGQFFFVYSHSSIRLLDQ